MLTSVDGDRTELMIGSRDRANQFRAPRTDYARNSEISPA
jgi:hypothetical protein